MAVSKEVMSSHDEKITAGNLIRQPRSKSVPSMHTACVIQSGIIIIVVDEDVFYLRSRSTP